MLSPPSALLGEIRFSDVSVAWVGGWCWDPASLPSSFSVSSALRAPFLLTKSPCLLPSPLPSSAAAGGTSIGSLPAASHRFLHKTHHVCAISCKQTIKQVPFPVGATYRAFNLSLRLLAVNILAMLLFESQSFYF